MSNENFHIRPINDLEGYNFFVNDYQRGYKWSVQQVVDLIKDIAFFDPDAVNELFDNDKKIFEVIDGQQRQTTIHLILKIIDKPIYNIRYKTREESKIFLDEIEEKLAGFDIDWNDNVDELTKAVNNVNPFFDINKKLQKAFK